MDAINLIKSVPILETPQSINFTGSAYNALGAKLSLSKGTESETISQSKPDIVVRVITTYWVVMTCLAHLEVFVQRQYARVMVPESLK